MAFDALFAPLKIKNLTLRNRFALAAMSRYSSPGQRPGRELIDYFRRRAEGEVGLILTGAAGVDRPAANNSLVLADFRPPTYDEWGECAAAVHAAGSHIGAQLWHHGALHPDKHYRPAPIESPSGLMQPGKKVGEPMTEAEGEAVIAAFAKGAVAAQRLGFDIVEIHAAHGYLLDQFLWEGTNQRTDRWGGPRLVDRLRFVLDVTRAVRAAVGPDMVVAIRISQWKEQDYDAKLAATPDELRAWVEPLVDAGIDVFDCSQRRFWTPEFQGSSLNFAGWVKKLTGKPTITCGSIGVSNDVMTFFDGEPAKPAAIDGLAERLEAGEFDLVAVGRALLVDPQWVQKVRDGSYARIEPFDKNKAERVY